MSKQPEALRLADWLEADTTTCLTTIEDVGAELRHQHALIEELREALGALHRACVADGWEVYGAHPYTLGVASAALAKAEPK